MHHLVRTGQKDHGRTTQLLFATRFTRGANQRKLADDLRLYLRLLVLTPLAGFFALGDPGLPFLIDAAFQGAYLVFDHWSFGQIDAEIADGSVARTPKHAG